jgi:hypothetical protein
MILLQSDVLETLWYDFDRREALLRRVIGERLAENPPPHDDDYVIATYFFAFRTLKLQEAVAEISYHATTGVKHAAPGSLLDQCSARPAGVDAFDDTGRLGLLHVAFPLKMMLQPDGHLTSSDLLHTTAGAIIFDVYENQDARLVHLQIPNGSSAASRARPTARRGCARPPAARPPSRPLAPSSSRRPALRPPRSNTW